ncbi:winged helix-turn-helix transcriptional regulator [bacterium]|nr:winged helix-turn-helix transcriptional regulator [bacterium]
MERRELHELEILKFVEESPRLNNRLAARKLGVSVKLAHEILKKMVAKGWLHVKKEHARRWDYFLTPPGLAEKTRLTYEFLDFSFQFYREARRRSAQLCRDLSESGTRRVAFIGGGEMAEIVYLGVTEWGLELVEVYDPSAAGRTFMGRPVLPFDQLAGSRAERLIVCLYNKAHPMTPDFLPDGVQRDPRMLWVFAAPTP